MLPFSCGFVNYVNFVHMKTVRTVGISFSIFTYRMFKRNCVFFARIFKIFPPLPCQHWTAIGCTENGQPIGVSVLSPLR